MEWILPFKTTTMAQPKIDQVGGKALSLIEMTRQNMPVPPGFVLTVKFFEPWLTTLQATPEMQRIRQGQPEELGPATRAIKAQCLTLEYTEQQQTELDKAFAAFQAANQAALFAVRSSSPEEDLEGASFAGSYESTLGVTPKNLQAAIRRSFASCFSERVFVYKKEQGLPIQQPRIAVIVQQQIDADSAGVAFSLNPLNNCYDEVVINANYGLGESVVTGEVQPDLFVIDKISHQIIETQIGKKETAVTLLANGGTTQTTREPDQQPCLTPAQVLDLASLVASIETQQNKPVDIEWAIGDEKIYLLQVRPITTYLPLADEMLTPPGSPKYLYADSTLIEQGVEKPLSVLGIDLVRYILKVMGASLGGDIAGVEGITFTAGGRYYMNLSHSLKMMGRNGALAPGSVGDASVMAILDSIDLGPYLPEKLPPKLVANKRKMPLKIAPFMMPIVKAFIRPELFLRQYEKKLSDHLHGFANVMDNNLSMAQQAVNLTDLLNFFFVDYGIPIVFAPQLAQMRLKKMFAAEASEEVNAHLLSLGTSLPGNNTAVMGAAMVALAASETIKTHTSAETFVTHLEQRTLDPEFLQAWDQFMAEFGARCPREIDVATPRPYEQPALLFAQLKQMAMAFDNHEDAQAVFRAAQAKREAAYLALHEKAGQMGKRQAKAFDRYYKTWVTLGGYRETSKHYVVKIVAMFRRRALEVGETLAGNGRLDHPSQIFDLTINDIDQALANPTLDLRALAQERTQLIKRIKQSHLVARVIDSRGKIYYPPRPKAAEGELVGVAISPGLVRGRVKILRSADEKKLLPGEILVTRATDPGWTPLFINAGGIILEIGGALQHGAVVAREYGLPCVSNVDGATDILHDGQWVEVDGSHGSVRILETAATYTPILRR